jgi:NAD(P) transhydrogenase
LGPIPTLGQIRGQAATAQRAKANSVACFVETTFRYPAMAAAYRVATLSGLNRLF